MNATGAHQRRSLVAFFILFLVLGAPIVVFANVQVFPNVPLFTFGALLPATTAVILSYRENRSAGVMELLRRSIDFKRVTSRLWYLPILLTWPFLVFLQCGFAFLSGLPVSSPHARIDATATTAPAGAEIPTKLAKAGDCDAGRGSREAVRDGGMS